MTGLDKSGKTSVAGREGGTGWPQEGVDLLDGAAVVPVHHKENSNVSISEYLGHILEDAVPKEIIYSKKLKPLTREKLERVLKVREEIIAHTYGRTFDDSTELIRQMREERTRELDEL